MNMDIENIASSVKDNVPSQNVENSRAGKIKKNSNARKNRMALSPYTRESQATNSKLLSERDVEKNLQRRPLREDYPALLYKDNIDGSAALYKAIVKELQALEKDGIDGSAALYKAIVKELQALDKDNIDGSAALYKAIVKELQALEKDGIDGSAALYKAIVKKLQALEKDGIDGSAALYKAIVKELQENESKKKLDEDDIKIQDGSHSSVVQKVGNEFMQKTTDEGISVHPLPPACIGDLSNERFFALEAGQYFGREFILDIEEYSDKMRGLEYIHRTVKTEKRFRFLDLPIPCTSAHAYERIANECNKDELADKSQGITRPNFVPGIVYQ